MLNSDEEKSPEFIGVSSPSSAGSRTKCSLKLVSISETDLSWKERAMTVDLSVSRFSQASSRTGASPIISSGPSYIFCKQNTSFIECVYNIYP